MNIESIPGFTEPFSSISHLLSSFLFLIIGSILVMRSLGNKPRVFSLTVFVLSNIFLFAMSGVYHLLEKGSTASYVLQILDHNGIFLLIAGTFTPLHTILTRKYSRWPILLLVWLIGINGIVFTSIFFSDMPHWLNLSFYLGMGWIGLFTLYKIHKHSRACAIDLIFGGVAYTIGAIIDATNAFSIWAGVIGPHEIFHIFVIIGTAFSWKIMFRVCKYPISQKLTGIIKEYADGNFKGFFTTERPRFYSNSKEELQREMQNWTRENYIPEHLPKNIKFKYFNEESLTI